MSYEAWGEPDGRPWPVKPRGLPACQGGWCLVRESCGRYHQEAGRETPAPRLCSKGGVALWKPIAKPKADVFWRRALTLVSSKDVPMTRDQITAMFEHARNIVALHAAGEAVDEFSLEWAEALLAQNPDPIQAPAEKEQQTWL